MPADVDAWSTSEFTGDGDVQGHLWAAPQADRRGDRLPPSPRRPAHHLHRPLAARRREPRGLHTAARRDDAGGLSASGSTVLAVSRRGEIYTRLYDFDTSGANTVFGSYSWQQDRPAGDTRWQLPPAGWVRHQNPPGTITDRLEHREDRCRRGRPAAADRGADTRRAGRVLGEADRPRDRQAVALRRDRRPAAGPTPAVPGEGRARPRRRAAIPGGSPGRPPR